MLSEGDTQIQTALGLFGKAAEMQAQRRELPPRVDRAEADPTHSPRRTLDGLQSATYAVSIGRMKEADMAPMIARIFRNGRNQAVRIPVELSLDAETVTIERQGDALILRPLAPGGWDRFFADASLVLPPDFEPGDDLAPQDRPPL